MTPQTSTIQASEAAASSAMEETMGMAAGIANPLAGLQRAANGDNRRTAGEPSRSGVRPLAEAFAILLIVVARGLTPLRPPFPATPPAPPAVAARVRRGRGCLLRNH